MLKPVDQTERIVVNPVQLTGKMNFEVSIVSQSINYVFPMHYPTLQKKWIVLIKHKRLALFNYFDMYHCV